MSHRSNARSPTLPTLASSSTIDAIHNLTATVQTYTSRPAQSNSQTTQNIIFGVFAILLALVAILIGWLQLRSFKRQECDEEKAMEQAQYELVEVYTLTHRRTLTGPFIGQDGTSTGDTPLRNDH